MSTLGGQANTSGSMGSKQQGHQHWCSRCSHTTNRMVALSALLPTVQTKPRFGLLSGAPGGASASLNSAFLHHLIRALERRYHTVAALRTAMGYSISPAS